MRDLDWAAQDELLNLMHKWRERQIVLAGLRAKLGHYARTQHLSYRYDICPVCRDVGSTEQNPKCVECYINYACHVPFQMGFRDDPARGAQYFHDMFDYIAQMTPVLVVGGDWNQAGGRPSKIAALLAEHLNADLLNGGPLERLPVDLPPNYEDVVWLPNIPNEEPKTYPRKTRGTVMVVSKVMHEGVTAVDAAKRIFAMHGNAVLEISTDTPRSFRLADALNVEWAHTPDLLALANGLDRFFMWSKGTERVSSQCVGPTDQRFEDTALLEIVHRVADEVENQVGQRYFGNVSTRCTKTFPSCRAVGGVWVSARNVDKQRIEADDMVLVYQNGDGSLAYFGDRKPSVDAPIQLCLYQRFPFIGCMLHGHAYVSGAPMTEEYFACGDLREFTEIMPLLEVGHRAINLRNHGFLLVGSSAADLAALWLVSNFENRL